MLVQPSVSCINVILECGPTRTAGGRWRGIARGDVTVCSTHYVMWAATAIIPAWENRCLFHTVGLICGLFVEEKDVAKCCSLAKYVTWRTAKLGKNSFSVYRSAHAGQPMQRSRAIMVLDKNWRASIWSQVSVKTARSYWMLSTPLTKSGVYRSLSRIVIALQGHGSNFLGVPSSWQLS